MEKGDHVFIKTWPRCSDELSACGGDSPEGGRAKGPI